MRQKPKYLKLRIALTLAASFLINLATAQPVVTVDPACNVVVTGVGVGVALGFGGTVGSGGVVVMPDPFTSTAGFTIIPNLTVPTGWTLSGDLSVVFGGAPPMAPVQASGPISPLMIESYNENMRTIENTGPSSAGFLARSKGRISLSYATVGCAPGCGGGAAISFDVYKSYIYNPANFPNDYVPPIVGPGCWDVNTSYTYSVDQIASDNLFDGIGLDRYYWEIKDGSGTVRYSQPPALPLGYFSSEYTSADNSSISFTTPGVMPPSDFPFKVTVCYGRANPWDGDAIPFAAHTTCVTKTIDNAPQQPNFSTPIPTCYNTGLSTFGTTWPVVVGLTYSWSCSNGSWTLSSSPGSLSISTMDDNPAVLSLTITGPCMPATFTYTVTRSFDPGVTSISGSSCVDEGTTNPYIITSGAAVLNNVTCFTAPPGWTVTPTNGSGSMVDITVPFGTIPGAYNISAISCACPLGVINFIVNVRPAVPTGLSGPACVDRNGTSPYSYSCTPVSGATSYSWGLPIGWSCSGLCPTNNPSLLPGGGSTGPDYLTVIANGTGGCNSAASAAYQVDYNPVTPAGFSVGCFSFGIAGTTYLTVGSAPSASFYGTYTVSSAPAGLLSSYSVDPFTGLITLNTLATASGSYTLTITHVTTSCGSSAGVTYVVNVAGNGAILTPIYNPSIGASDVFIESGAPGGSTFTWSINGSGVPGTGSALVLSTGVPAPGPICVYATFGGCTTVACAAPGTHGLTPHPGDGGSGGGALDPGNTSLIFAEQTKVYPNPNNGTFKVEIPSFKTSAILSMVDGAGKSVGYQILQAGVNTISRKNLAAGTYYLVLKADDVEITYTIAIQ